MKKINLNEKFELFDDTWHPRIVASSNGQLIKLAKGEGELVWHSHENEDEVFLVLAGELTLAFRDERVVLEAGEMYVVSAGREHCPSAAPGTRFLLIEPATTQHTGNVVSEKTVSVSAQEWI
ncbi:MAG: cupin domain-containing protein [Pseudomonadales bacterium]|nr:cupin domain-containing protein [Pseudomonadales bacterium]